MMKTVLPNCTVKTPCLYKYYKYQTVTVKGKGKGRTKRRRILDMYCGKQGYCREQGGSF